MGEEKKYKLIFKGEIAEGFDESTVKDQLGKLLCIENAAEVEKIFSSQVVVLKKDLSLDEINRYFLAIRKTGAVTEISDSSSHQATKETERPVLHTEPRTPNLFALQLSPGIMNNVVRKDGHKIKHIAAWTIYGGLVLSLLLVATGFAASKTMSPVDYIRIAQLAAVCLLCLALFIVGVRINILKNRLYYSPFNAEEARFNISDSKIQWLSAIPQPRYKIELLLCTAALLLATGVLSIILESIPIFSSIVMIWLALVLFAQHYAYTRALLCHLGILGNSLIAADHRLHYRVGRHAEIQYRGDHISIGDTVVYCGSQLFPVFGQEQIDKTKPILKSAIKTDFTSLLIKLAHTGHPQFMVYLALIGGGALSIVVALLSSLLGV